jgi:hypothetical protein
MTTIVDRRNFNCPYKYILNFFLFLGLIFFTGCSTADYGSLKHSRDITQAFETYHVFPNCRYYYLNQENNPYAVIALKAPYTLSSSNQWTEFDPDSDKFKKEVGLVEGFPVNYSYSYGSYILDHQGNQIGYWYSSLRLTSIKVDDESKKVSVYTETPWLHDDNWGFGTGIGVGIGSGGSGVGVRIGR